MWPPGADAVRDEALPIVVLPLTKEQGGKRKHNADMVVRQMIRAVIHETVTHVEIVGFSAGVAAMECLLIFPTTLSERYGDGAYAVEQTGKGLGERHLVRQVCLHIFVAECIGDGEGILPTSTPRLIMGASEKIAEKIVKKRTIRRFVEDV